MTEPVRVREIVDEEGRHLPRITRRRTGSVVTQRRAETVLLSAQSMPVTRIAKAAYDDVASTPTPPPRQWPSIRVARWGTQFYLNSLFAAPDTPLGMNLYDGWDVGLQLLLHDLKTLGGKILSHGCQGGR